MSIIGKFLDACRDAYDALTHNYAYAGSSFTPSREEDECETFCSLINKATVLWKQYEATVDGYTKNDNLSDENTHVYQRTQEKGCTDLFFIDASRGDASQETVCHDSADVRNVTVNVSDDNSTLI